MSAYVYLIRCKDDSLYGGYTTNVDRRLQQHQCGKGAKYTRGRGPLSLAYCQLLPDNSCALRWESHLKKLPREKKLQLCQNWQQEQLRLAQPQDSEGIRAIYQYYVEHTPATFAYTTPDSESYQKWVAQSLADYPFLVLEEQRGILGFACAHRWREREAFDWSVETTIYLAPTATGGGRGIRLYGALLALLKEQGLYQAYGVVTSPNPASEALHKRIGFQQLAYQPNCGFKQGQWYGTTTWGYTLCMAEGIPAPVKPFFNIDPQKIQQILSHC